MYVDYSKLLKFSYSNDDKEFLLKLLIIDGLGRKTAANILLLQKKHEDSYGEFWGIVEKNLKNKRLINKVKRSSLEQDIYSLKKWLKKHKVIMIFFWENEYPALLKQTDDFPLLLFVKGDLSLLNSNSVAVVGTRKVTSYGKQVTRKLVQDLVDYDYTIISGCMYGVDDVAHQATIENKGKTIAVLGYGFNTIVSSDVINTQAKILSSGGCIISEYFPDVQANKGTFPQRNRIVAGMSLGVLVTEAALKSGTHITAGFALEAGREVFAVPGSIFNPYTQGTKYLINQGAKLVTSGQDIVAEFKKVITIPDSYGESHTTIDIEATIKSFGLDNKSEKIVRELVFLPLTTQELVKKTNFIIKELLTLLGMLELENIVKNEDGKWQCVLSYSGHLK